MKIFFVLLALFQIAGPDTAFSVAQSSQQKLTARLAAYDRDLSQSVSVIRARDGKTLFQHHSKTSLVPASVLKLITSSAVLEAFPVGHRFRTKAYSEGRLQDGILLGDLTIVGDGDPYLVSEKVWQLAVDLKHLGLREVRGNLKLDGSIFAGPARDASRQEGVGESSHAYDAAVSAIGVNFNTIEVAVAPGYGIGSTPRVAVAPYPLRGVLVENHMRTVRQGSRNALNLKRISMLSKNQSAASHNNAKLVAKGQVAMGSGLKKIYRSSADHIQTSGEIIRAFLQKEGIRIRGGITTGRLGRSAVKLVEVESYPLSYILKGLNTYSNNYVADVLVKRLGAAHPPSGPANRPGSGTYANGLGFIQRHVESSVRNKEGFKLQNGSGLGFDNRLSANRLAQILGHMSKNLALFPDLMASLPVSGVEGTLKDRFRRASTRHLKGKIRAKTGTLTDPFLVSSLAGYFQHPKHGLCAFAIIQNGKQGRRSRLKLGNLRDFQDRLVSEFMVRL